MSHRLRVVVADDDEASLVLYQRHLTRLGHEIVCIARNGKELVETCASTMPDLVITDIKMPIMDGFEASLEIARRLTVPIILVSGFYKHEYLKHIRYRHISAYLMKPLDEDGLRRAIDEAMSKTNDPRPPAE